MPHGEAELLLSQVGWSAVGVVYRKSMKRSGELEVRDALKRLPTLSLLDVGRGSVAKRRRASATLVVPCVAVVVAEIVRCLPALVLAVG